MIFFIMGILTRLDLSQQVTLSPNSAPNHLSSSYIPEQDDSAYSFSSPSNTESELCRSMAVRWLVDCITRHEQCRRKHCLENWFPTRLIDVGITGEWQQPRLLLKSDIQSGFNNGYVTLSHRWASTQTIKLVSSNIDSFKHCIPLESLSSIFQDAIKVTRAFGFQYLWIDFLCIVRDSLTDWKTESAQMAKIYGNCLLNIAATGSSDHGGGLFQNRNTHWVTPSNVRIQYKGHDKIYSASLYGLWGKYVARSTLNR